jgi:hypothetical protein
MSAESKAVEMYWGSVNTALPRVYLRMAHGIFEDGFPTYEIYRVGQEKEIGTIAVRQLELDVGKLSFQPEMPELYPQADRYETYAALWRCLLLETSKRDGLLVQPQGPFKLAAGESWLRVTGMPDTEAVGRGYQIRNTECPVNPDEQLAPVVELRPKAGRFLTNFVES